MAKAWLKAFDCSDFDASLAKAWLKTFGCLGFDASLAKAWLKTFGCSDFDESFAKAWLKTFGCLDFDTQSTTRVRLRTDCSLRVKIVNRLNAYTSTLGQDMSNCFSHGTLLHFSLQSSLLNICYYHQDLHHGRFHPGSRPRLHNHPRALLLIGASHLPQWPSISRPLQRHPFSGLVHSAGELLHTP